jgi:hypothetical protein
MSIKNSIVGVFMFLLGITSIQAQQDTLKILDAFIVLELDTIQLYVNPSNINGNNLDSLGFCVKVSTQFSDTSNIDSVHLKVGRTLGASDVANLSLGYNGGNISPNIASFVVDQNGFCVCVASSEYDAYTLYLEVWADDKLGNTTPIYSMKVN